MHKNPNTARGLSPKNQRSFLFINGPGKPISYFDKGSLINITTWGSVCLSTIALIIPWGSFHSVGVLIGFKLLFATLLALTLWQYLNSVSEIKTDDEYLYIRKLKRFKKIAWNDIQHIKTSIRSIVGLYYFRIKKKKEGRRLETQFFIIWLPLREKMKMEARSKLLEEINKRTKLKY